ncbi:MAG: hypothetical protein U0802_25050 [Candidatus Binatia bacterium]
MRCAPRRPAPPPPLVAVALLPIADQPERSAVTGIFTFYSWIADTRAAVPEALATAIRDALVARGITVVPARSAGAPTTVRQASDAVAAAHLDTPALFVVIDRWEAENVTAPQRVDVGLDATLFAPNGKILWTTRREAAQLSTLNATDLTSAYRKAAASAAAWLVADWTAAP